MSGSPSCQCPAAMIRSMTPPDLGGGHRGQVIIRTQPDRVQQPGPRRPARFQRGYQRVRPARDHLRAVVPPPVAVAERPARAGRRVRPQPVAHIDRQPDPAIIPARQRHPGQCPAQPRDLHLPAVQRVVQGAMAALMPWLQRQFRQHMHPVLLAQRRVAQLQQRVRPGGEAPVQLPAEPCQPFPCLICLVPGSRPGLRPGHTESHGHRPASSSSVVRTRR